MVSIVVLSLSSMAIDWCFAPVLLRLVSVPATSKKSSASQCIRHSTWSHVLRDTVCKNQAIFKHFDSGGHKMFSFSDILLLMMIEMRFFSQK